MSSCMRERFIEGGVHVTGTGSVEETYGGKNEYIYKIMKKNEVSIMKSKLYQYGMCISIGLHCSSSLNVDNRRIERGELFTFSSKETH